MNMIPIAPRPKAARMRRAVRKLVLVLLLVSPLPAFAAQKPVPPGQPSDRATCRFNCNMKYGWCHDLPRSSACFRDFNACMRTCG